MSAVEVGFGGIWSCVYCEGAWLPARQVELLVAEANAPLPSRSGARTEAQAVPGLLCPSCNSAAYVALAAEGSAPSVCTQCAGVFLRRGQLESWAPGAASPELEAPVPAAMLAGLASALILDPAPLMFALERRGIRKNAL
jgi:Zn-finger nucleic acid-binding protein